MPCDNRSKHRKHSVFLWALSVYRGEESTNTSIYKNALDLASRAACSAALLYPDRACRLRNGGLVDWPVRHCSDGWNLVRGVCRL